MRKRLHKQRPTVNIVTTPDSVLGIALDAMERTPDPRLREVMASLTRHLHAFVQEVKLSEDEFERALDFIVALGQALLAGNRALAANYRRVVNELDLYRRETLARSAENIPISTRDHEAIVDAVARRDERLAERLLFEHVTESRERLHRALAKPPAGAKPRRAA